MGVYLMKVCVCVLFYRKCFKAYHPDCVGKDESALTSDKRWTCSKPHISSLCFHISATISVSHLGCILYCYLIRFLSLIVYYTLTLSLPMLPSSHVFLISV